MSAGQVAEMKYALLWMLGIPIPILIVLWLFFR